jgi:hypothetical protein
LALIDLVSQQIGESPPAELVCCSTRPWRTGFSRCDDHGVERLALRCLRESFRAGDEARGRGNRPASIEWPDRSQVPAVALHEQALQPPRDIVINLPKLDGGIARGTAFASSSKRCWLFLETVSVSEPPTIAPSCTRHPSACRRPTRPPCCRRRRQAACPPAARAQRAPGCTEDARHVGSGPVCTTGT